MSTLRSHTQPPSPTPQTKNPNPETRPTWPEKMFHTDQTTKSTIGHERHSMSSPPPSHIYCSGRSYSLPRRGNSESRTGIPRHRTLHRCSPRRRKGDGRHQRRAGHRDRTLLSLPFPRKGRAVREQVGSGYRILSRAAHGCLALCCVACRSRAAEATDCNCNCVLRVSACRMRFDLGCTVRLPSCLPACLHTCPTARWLWFAATASLDRRRFVQRRQSLVRVGRRHTRAG